MTHETLPDDAPHDASVDASVDASHDASDDAANAPSEPRRRTGFWVAIGAAGTVAVAALATFVLIVAIGVLRDAALPTAAASRALLTANDLAHVPGVGISVGSHISKSGLPAYVKKNPLGDPRAVTPSRCAENLEGWMAWAALDTSSSPGWKHDVIYAATNIIVDTAPDYGNNIQQSRRFVSAAAATAFMRAQRSWYSVCGNATYRDGDSPTKTASFNFAPIALNLGLDSIVEGSNDRGNNLPPHLLDVYLRNRNIVYALEIVTPNPPQDGLDTASLALVRAAAKKIEGLG